MDPDEVLVQEEVVGYDSDGFGGVAFPSFLGGHQVAEYLDAVSELVGEEADMVAPF